MRVEGGAALEVVEDVAWGCVGDEDVGGGGDGGPDG